MFRKMSFILFLVLLKTMDLYSQNCSACFTMVPDSVNPSVILVDASCSNASPFAYYDWSVNGTVMFTSFQPDVQLPFSTSGSYLITLTLHDVNCVDSTSQNIVINQVCSAGFIPYNVLNGYFYFYPAGLFSQSANYNWDFGDGTTTNGAYVAHHYSSVGAYNVCLSVSDSNCNDTQCQMVNVATVSGTNNCIASFTPYVDSVLGYFYADASTSAFDPNNAVLTWMLDGVIIQQSASPFVSGVFTSPGTHTLTLLISDMSLVPCDSNSQTLLYNPQWSSIGCYSCFNYNYNATYDSIYLSSCSMVPSGGSILWYVNGSTFSNNSPAFMQGFASPGFQTIGLYVLDSIQNVCDSSFQYIYTYSPPCVSCLTITPVSGSTSDYLLDGSCSALNYAFNWYVNGNYVITSYAPQFQYSFNQSGSYTVCMESMDSIGNYCSQACSTFNVTTSPSTNFDLSGRVYKFNSSFSYSPVGSGEAKVYLIKLMTGGILDAIDSVITDANGYYYFNNKPIDDYRVKVALLPTSPDYSMNIPTYYSSGIMWYDAQVITLFGNTYNRDVYMQYGMNTGGAGFISGNVFAGANKGGKTRSGNATDVTLILINLTTNQPVAYSKPNANGNYTFNNIPFGEYKLMGELLNRASIPETIVLSSSQSAFTNKNFVFNNSVIQPTSSALSVSDEQFLEDIQIQPNPAVSSFEVFSKDTRFITVTDMSGRQIVSFKLKAGDKMRLNCNEWNKGLYLIRSQSSGLRNVQKLLVQ